MLNRLTNWLLAQHIIERRLAEERYQIDISWVHGPNEFDNCKKYRVVRLGS